MTTIQAMLLTVVLNAIGCAFLSWNGYYLREYPFFYVGVGALSGLIVCGVLWIQEQR